MSNIIKVVLAVLFFICLADMPYGYFQFVRFIALIGFILLALDAKKLGRPIETFLYIVLAILFQPFFKIALGRELWNLVDVVVGIGLIVSVFSKREKIEQSK